MRKYTIHIAIGTVITRDRKIVIKFDNYSYEIFAPIVIVNSYKNGQNSYQIVLKSLYIFPKFIRISYIYIYIYKKMHSLSNYTHYI